MRKVLIAFSLLLPVLTMLAAAPAASAVHPSLTQLKAELRKAKRAKSSAVARADRAAAYLTAALALQDADTSTDVASSSDETATDPTAVLPPELVSELLADGVVSDDEIAVLRKQRKTEQARVKKWSKKVASLRERIARREQIARWNRQGNWWPLIKIAAAKYGVNAEGLRRLMILESSGNRCLGSTYCGLFQYYPGTWRGKRNPWRGESIYDGWAQIRATAYALHRGMGPHHWPNTSPLAF